MHRPSALPVSSRPGIQAIVALFGGDVTNCQSAKMAEYQCRESRQESPENL